MINPQFITRKMLLVLIDLERVEKLSHKTEPQFLQSPIDAMLSERLLSNLINRTIDINIHLLVHHGKPVPTSYYESFLDVGRLGAAPMPVCERIAPAAGLLSRVLHEYGEVDRSRLYRGLARGVTDFKEYLRGIDRFCFS